MLWCCCVVVCAKNRKKYGFDWVAFFKSARVWKHIVDIGMKQMYVNDAEFSLHLRMITMLAFVTADNVILAFEKLSDHLRYTYPDIEGIDQFLEYFEDTYIGRYRRNAPRRPPHFSIELWNMYHRTEDELPCTNNSIEGWHHGCQANVSCLHPTIWKFIDLLEKSQSLNRVNILQAMNGYAAPSQRRKYRDRNVRILAIVDDFPNQHVLAYLRAIAITICHYREHIQLT